MRYEHSAPDIGESQPPMPEASSEEALRGWVRRGVSVYYYLPLQALAAPHKGAGGPYETHSYPSKKI